MPDHSVERLPLAQAADRLGITTDSIRRRIRRGKLRAYKDNQGRWLVEVPSGHAPGPGPERVAGGQLAGLRDQLERLGAELAEVRSEYREQVADLRAERDRLLALVERLTAERALPPQRPWPGARAAWRRFWTGDG